MRNNPLSQLMNPKSIAIVGAGNNPSKMGTLHGLSIVKGGYLGKFYPIHPREEKVLGHQAYRAVADLPEVPDLAMLIVPAEQAIKLLAEFGQLGTKHAIVVTAGFRETGEEGRLKEEQLKEVAASYGMRFLGPNCIGILNSEILLNTTVMPGSGKQGKLGMVSQSGTYVTQTLPYLKQKGIHFSKAISVGNEADIDLVDALEFLGQDEQTKAIAIYLEGVSDGRRFIEVAQKITPRKPVIVQYVGGSAAGARAGMSHTGSMAGPDFLYEGILKQAGIIQVQMVEELYSYGWTLAAQPPLRGKRIGIVTNSGGPGTAIANACEHGKLDVPAFSPKLQQQLREHILPHASSANPVDLTYHLDAKVLTAVIPEIIMQSGEADGVIVHGGMSHGFMKVLYPHVRELLGNVTLEQFLSNFDADFQKTVSLPWEYEIPLVASSFFGREDDYTANYLDHGIPVFDSPEKAARALATLLRYKEIRERKPLSRSELPAVAPQAQAIIAAAVARQQQTLTEYESKQLLAAYGIPVTGDRLALSEEAAVAAALAVGFPVVLKGSAADVAHKTEKGLVHLGLTSAEEVRLAYRAVRKEAGAEIPVIVAEMLPRGRELLVGMTRFPAFGPCVMLGLGGIFAEALRDITFRAAPLGEAEAEEMLQDLRAKAIFEDFRGMPAVDRAALLKILVTLGQLALLHPEIAEIDINPVMINGSQPVAVDALVVLA
ncbi:MAG: acetate--CoA ligase family protein [Firmicutes bacterium]|nr:acetate--CoA ligase family protein [Bacillota bacterium]MCL5993782.1 acetate--CoA ligase family protein [Bacillota bacterium]